MEASEVEQNILVHRIKITPRKTGNSTCSGYIYINDGLWNVNRFELNFNKGGLKIYDNFKLTQAYQATEDGIWQVYRQAFDYEEKQGRSKTFKGKTTILYPYRENNYKFPPKFFGNEIATTSQEAYERDSTYWNDIRPESLTEKEAIMVRYRDSITAVHTSKAYLDSLDAEFQQSKIGRITIARSGFSQS